MSGVAEFDVTDGRTASLKERHARLPGVLEQVDRHLQRITRVAYANVDLVSNEVLSRNPCISALLHKVLWGDRAARPGFVAVSGWLAQYYVKSLVHFLLYVITWLVQQIAADRRTPVLDAEVYVIDTFVLQDAVTRERRYDECYFPGLAAVLRKHGKRVVILPRFLGPLGHPFPVADLMRVLRRSGETFVTEFELLRASDLLRTLGFIVRYPIEVLRLARRVGQEAGDVNALVSVELQRTLPQVTFSSHLRYLVGRRLGARAPAPLHVISWFENQAIDKNFYRGARETAPGATIFGCQPFVFAPPYMNDRLADAEASAHVTPDIVLVSGRVYLRHDCTVPHRLGPSFRNGWLWSSPIDWARKQETVVFLPYYESLAEDVIGVGTCAATLQGAAVAVRPFPFRSAGRLPDLPGGWHYTDRTRVDLLTSALVLITSESGASVEAAACGCSVIVVASQSTITFNPMLDEGRGEIWELVFDAKELDRAFEQLRDYREQHPERIRELADWYRDAFFVEPSEQRIAEAFNL